MRRSSRNSALAVLLVRSVRRRFVNCAIMIVSLSHEHGPRLRRLITLLQPGAVASPPLDDALGDDVDDGASDVSRASSIRDAQELVRALGSLKGQADRSPAQRRRQRGGALQHESPPRFAKLRAALQRRTGLLQPLRFCTMLSCGALQCATASHSRRLRGLFEPHRRHRRRSNALHRSESR
jgi:hypothetical protein